MTLDRSYVEKVYAGWLGKIMGVRHGAPVEGWSSEEIERLFGDLDGFVIDVDIFEPDDDINGPLFFLRALEDTGAGADITSAQMATAWTNYPPCEHGFFWWPGYGKPTAYHLLDTGDAALSRSGPPDAGLGPRIFVDTWGYVSPGDLPLAAQLARRALRCNATPGGAAEDASVLQACMIAAAFAEDTPEAVLLAALAMIPAEGDIAQMARDVLAMWRSHPDDWKKARAHIVARWSAPRFPGMFHAVSNTAYILLGLLYSGGNLKRGLELCTQCGLDTDCNSGNLGAVLGVLGGLPGIDAGMRRTMNDVVICSSVLGEQNIGDIPTQAKWIAAEGFRLAGQTPPAWLTRAEGMPLCLDFALPGATHGLRAASHADTVVRPGEAAGERFARIGCRAFDARTGMRVFHRTYYRPADLHNNRYDPCFSPKVYPGQTITATVRLEAASTAPLVASLFAYDDNAGQYHDGPVTPLAPGAWTTITWQIPPMQGACIAQVGIHCTLLQAHEPGFTVDVRQLEVTGTPDYAMQFAKERMEVWGFVQHEASQFTYSRGSWHYDGDALRGLVATHGEALTGARSWTDYQVACTVTPQTAQGARLLLRAQGAYRYYAVALVKGGIALIRQRHGEERLAFAPYAWQTGAPVRLQAQAQGSRLCVLMEGKILLDVEDTAYASGCVGLGLDGPCAEAAFEALAVHPAEEVRA